MISAQRYYDLRCNLDEAIEEEIDKAINDNLAALHTWLTVQVKPAWSYEGVERVLARYRAAGWKAEYVTDRRDGNYLRLEPKT